MNRVRSARISASSNVSAASQKRAEEASTKGQAMTPQQRGGDKKGGNAKKGSAKKSPTKKSKAKKDAVNKINTGQ